MPDEGSWEAATWEGARRAHLRRAARRTVRERLEVLAALTRTSERLAQVGEGRRKLRAGEAPAPSDR